MAYPGSNQSRWIIYILLLILRFLGILQRGYIHPDEFFQGGQELFFGHNTRYYENNLLQNGNDYYHVNVAGLTRYSVQSVPWEFEPQNAVRSIIPPMFMTLLPLRVYASLRHWITLFSGVLVDTRDVINAELQRPFIQSSILWSPATNDLSGKEILLIPRLFMAILSVIFLDGSLWILTILKSKNIKQRKGSASTLSYKAYTGPPMEVIVLASSWPCLTFGVRPFTNNLEAMVLAFLLVVVSTNANIKEDIQTAAINSTNMMAHARQRTGGAYALLLIGATCSVGIFVRFTFAFFAFPVVALFLWHRWKNISFRLPCIVYDGLWLALSFLITSFAFIWVDTQYYAEQERLACDGTPVCLDKAETTLSTMLKYMAPYNALRYNSKSSNLAEHGIHPRITHAGELLLRY